VSVIRHVEQLRDLCGRNHRRTAPFVVRTRFERAFYGLLVTVAAQTFGSAPASLSGTEIQRFVQRVAGNKEVPVCRLLLEIGRVFGKFVYLCDTSNWSNDGQDPRVESCAPEILVICSRVEELFGRGATVANGAE
jgi:hypothetical protein